MEIYFDAAFKAPRNLNNCELCFCLQRGGAVLPNPQPSLCLSSKKNADLNDPQYIKVVFDYNHHYESIDPPCNMIVELREYSIDQS